uniref:Uncharacterized protein n=1 Tax=Alexandrium catenella TaxID=2925 RepID=A0A7S1RX63_ALECA
MGWRKHPLPAQLGDRLSHSPYCLMAAGRHLMILPELLLLAVLSSASARPSFLQSASARCSVILQDKFPASKGSYDFICDTCGWYHGDGSDKFPASAGSGGCHTYRFMKGTPPADCTSFAKCSACKDADLAGEEVWSYKLSKECQEQCTGETVACDR